MCIRDRRCRCAARGFADADFAEVADIVAQALLPTFDEAAAAGLRARVGALTAAFPLYPAL